MQRLSQIKTHLSSQSSPKMKHKVAVIGSGNWGTAVAKIAAENISEHTDLFDPVLNLWVFEETVNGEKLSNIINTKKENVKYLPGVKLPDNIDAITDIETVAKDADILIFNFPHQFASKILPQLKGHINPRARGISCIKGVDVSADGITLFPSYITRHLGIYCGALSGANIAGEIALHKFSETTIAYSPSDFHAHGHDVSRETIRKLFHRPYFHVQISHDVAGVCLCGALKNIVAAAAGFIDGLEWGNNAKAAVIRVGVLEMQRFGLMFFPDCKKSTFTEESCGIADVITSAAGGRNRLCAEQFVKTGKPMDILEKELLNGQKLQGAATARDVNLFLKAKDKVQDFPLFTAVYEIVFEGRKASTIVDYN